MNNKVFIANLTWLKPSKGGRKLPIPMNTDKYCPLVSVDKQKITLGSAWGLVCYSFEIIGEYNTLTYVRYLNTEDAPDNLCIGSKIDLFEGNNLVAIGKIVEETDFRF